MANFYLQINSLSRSAGRRATAAAAYRAGERIRDERTGDIHNFSRRTDVLHAEILLPTRLQGSESQWARDRSRLWNAAEEAETRRTARVAREFQVTLPAELSAAQRLSLARAFSQELADRYGIAVDLAIHEPRPGGDPRNFHAHLLATTREVTATGLGAKVGLDLHTKDRVRLGLPSSSEEFTHIRARWASLTNGALREAGLDVRVDHRSFAAQGIDREPRPRIPFDAVLLERAGIRSEVAERLRTEYAARASRRERDANDGPRSLEEIRQEAAQTWRRMRYGGLNQSEPQAAPSALEPEGRAREAPAKAPSVDRGVDDDYTP